MEEEQHKASIKQVRKLKRLATELAGEVHDLVEDRLWQDYEQLPDLVEKTRQACRQWQQAEQQLNQ